MLAGCLILVAAVVGVAHWRTHRLETADVAWSSPADFEGEVTVADGKVYVFDPGNGFQINRLSDGRQLASASAYDSLDMFVGSTGWFATVSETPKRLTFYAPDGRKAWERDLGTGQPAQNAPQVIGDDTIIFRDCHGDDDCVLRSVDSSGTSQWTLDSPERTQEETEIRQNLRQDEVYINRGDLHLLPSIAVVRHAGRVTAVGSDGKPRGESVSSANYAVVGDSLIEVGREGDECT